MNLCRQCHLVSEKDGSSSSPPPQGNGMFHNESDGDRDNRGNDNEEWLEYLAEGCAPDKCVIIQKALNHVCGDRLLLSALLRA